MQITFISAMLFLNALWDFASFFGLSVQSDNAIARTQLFIWKEDQTDAVVTRSCMGWFIVTIGQLRLIAAIHPEYFAFGAMSYMIEASFALQGIIDGSMKKRQAFIVFILCAIPFLIILYELHIAHRQ